MTWAAASTPPPGSLRDRHFGWGRFGHWRRLHFFLSFYSSSLLTWEKKNLIRCQHGQVTCHHMHLKCSGLFWLPARMTSDYIWVSVNAIIRKKTAPSKFCNSTLSQVWVYAQWFTQTRILFLPFLSRSAGETHDSYWPCCSRGLILLLHFLAEPLAAAEPIAALDGSFVLGYDCSDLLLEEGREPQGHAVNLERGRKGEIGELKRKPWNQNIH